MSTTIRTRSPRGCLTCKQRRKKCDETKPICQRCNQGKFKCLGYVYLDSPQSLPKKKEKPYTPLFSYAPMHLASSNAQGLFPSAEVSPAPTTPITRPLSSLGGPAKPLEGGRSQLVATAMAPTRPTQHHLGGVPGIIRLESEHMNKVIHLVLSQLSRLGYRIFMPGPVQPEAAIVRRVYRSDLLRWCMYLGAQIAQMLLDDGPRRKNYLHLIRHFHRQVVSDSPLSLSSDLTTRLGAALDLALYAFMVSDSATSYPIFKNTTPLWYRFAAKIPSMWSSGSTVSLAYAISTPRYEISKFILWDIIYAVAFGIPSILQYDTTHLSMDTRQTPLEWVYGCPLPFVILLAKINAFRSTCVPTNPGDWQEVEMHLKQWSPKPTYADKDSCKAIGRFAIQESWRQALYIYLYMGMCGADSADPRVAASVRQIVRLSSTIETTSPLGIHLFVPCLIASTAARVEQHRATLRTRIHASREANSWIMRGADFVPVLDHLWHGAAHRGRPVKWEDYVRSRCATFSIR
ncbi:hypothetical protein OPQ81_010503 [Rhizoctonia solani]|nr:hypothetical protein OPQ81_010503 [Rhizoctonia solani]